MTTKNKLFFLISLATTISTCYASDQKTDEPVLPDISWVKQIDLNRTSPNYTERSDPIDQSSIFKVLFFVI